MINELLTMVIVAVGLTMAGACFYMAWFIMFSKEYPWYVYEILEKEKLRKRKLINNDFSEG